VVPNDVPVIVTEVPIVAAGGDMPVTPGVTVKLAELLAIPTVTITGPEVAPVGTGTTIFALFQLVGLAVIPLKLTMLLP
jgi:hypothetical protein